MLKLYYSPGACSLAPHVILQETGLPFEAIRVDIRAKTYAGGNYYDINPKGGVPALGLDNGEVLTEDAVILQYIADQKPQTNLIPKTGLWERYRCQEWLNYIATELHKGFSPLWQPTTPDDYRQIARKNLELKFNYVNTQLGKQDYLMGNQLSVADAYLFTVINWTNFHKMDLTPWPHLKGFMERMAKRPSTVAALKAEGLLK